MAAYATVTLTGTYQTPDGTPHKGTVEIIPSERVIKDTTGDVILTGRVKVRLGHPAAEGEAGAENGWVHDGKFTVALPATDDPTLNPTGFGYTLAAKLHSTHLPAVSFALPAATPAVDVEDVTPVDPSTFEPTATYVESSTVTALDSRVTTLETTPTVTSYNDLTDTPTIPATASDVGAEPAGLSAATKAAQDAAYAKGADDVPSIVEGVASAATLSDVVLDMDRDGNLLRGNDTALQRSTDNGATWTTLYTFPRTVLGVRQMDTGELLVGLSGDSSSVLASVQKSTGYLTGSPTFAQKLQATDYGKAIELTWGFGGAGSVYAVSEYDTKTPGSRSARQVAWLTEDGGETWTEIYDHGTGALSRRHIHGVTYDPYRDAIWLVVGDYVTVGDGNNGIFVSWDRGQTWAVADATVQPTAIYCFPDCVIFGNDSPPNGVMRFDNPTATSLRLREAYRLNNATSADGGTKVLTHVAQSPFRARTATGHLLLIPFSPVVDGYTAQVLGTYDGYTWFEVWRDTTDNVKPTRAIGPTQDGRVLIGGMNKAQNGYVTAEQPAPASPGLLSAITRLSAGFQRAMPKRALVVWNNVSGQSIPTYTTTEITLKDTATYIEDTSGLFTLAPDKAGIIVNRDCYVRINADNGINIAAGTSAYVRIRLDGVNYKNDNGATLAAVLPVKAGTDIAVAAFVLASSPVTTIGTTALAIEAWEDHRA